MKAASGPIRYDSPSPIDINYSFTARQTPITEL